MESDAVMAQLTPDDMRRVTPLPLDETARLQATYLRLRRTFFRNLIFFLVCCILALILRRLLRFPPGLSWVVFAVPAVLFAGDVIRLLACGFKINRLQRSKKSL